MDDHQFTARLSETPHGCVALDPLDQELKTYLALVAEDELREAEHAAIEASGRAIEAALTPPAPGYQFRSLSDALAKIQSLLRTLGEIVPYVDDKSRLQSTVQFWTAAYVYFRLALARLSTLLARSLRATLRFPLFLDGPELSGYKHRLR
jgi:hypothetical protein